MTRINFIKLSRNILGMLLLHIMANCALAQPLDDVRLEYREQGVVATISMTSPVQYLRHFPSSHGKTLEIYYDRAQRVVPGDKNVVVGEVQPKTDVLIDEIWVDNETRKSPPSGLIPSFTVTTRDQQTQPKLVIEFSREAEFSVAPGKDNRSLLLTIIPERRPVSTGPLPFLPTIKPEPVPAVAAMLTPEDAALADTDNQARVLMVQGRDALSAKDNAAAVDAFNKLLMLSPNDYTQDAQEWVGVARERAGQADKAKIEYDLYLRLYPEGEGAARVAQRLTGLAGAGTAAKSVAGTEEKKQAARWMSFGSVSSRYYYGNSTTDARQIFNNVPETITSSLTDLSMLITSVDASERYVSEEYDGRLVFRDVATKNFLANQPSQNRVYAAYGEIKNRAKDYMVRLGRQSAMGGGVQGRFDGIAGSYSYVPDVRLNAVAGALEDYSQGGNRPVFYGASVDRGPVSVYAIKQSVNGATDRRALGTEFRYFEGSRSVFALLDYDTYFRALNAVQVMGAAGALGGTVNFMVDRRKTPSLSIRNALAGAGTSSIDALLQSMMNSDLRDLALARTATSSTGQLGITVPFREKWQVGADLRLTNTTGLPASGTTTLEGILAPTPSRGTEKIVTGQVIGSGLYKAGDIWSGSLSYNTSSEVNGYTIHLYNHTQLQSGWGIDSSLQLSSHNDQFDATTTRTSPMVRGAYKLGESLYVDVDGGLELAEFSAAQQTIKTTRYFYSAGLRLDF